MDIYTPKSLKSNKCVKNVYKSSAYKESTDLKIKFEEKVKSKKEKPEFNNFLIKYKDIMINRLRAFFEFEDSYYDVKD